MHALQRILDDSSKSRVEAAAAAAPRRGRCRCPRAGGGGRARGVLAVLAAALVGAGDAAVEALAIPLEAGGLAAAAARGVDERGAALGCASVCRCLDLFFVFVCSNSSSSSGGGGGKVKVLHVQKQYKRK